MKTACEHIGPRARVTFNGDFWLAWLLPSSYVLSAGDGSGAASVVNAEGVETRVDIGDEIEVPL